MKLYIAGVNHYDPLGRVRVRDWMRQLAEREGSPPVAVAPEWHPQVFGAIKASRRLLRRLLEIQWPDAPATFLDSLSETMGYEGDVHESLFPHADVIWLDPPRPEVEQFNPQDYAVHVMSVFRQALGNLPQNWSLERVSRFQWGIGSTEFSSDEARDRDARMARTLLSRLDTQAGWVVAIVGSLHASPEASLSVLATELGIPVQALMFRPSLLPEH